MKVDYEAIDDAMLDFVAVEQEMKHHKTSNYTESTYIVCVKFY